MSNNVDVEKIVREFVDKTLHLSLATIGDNAPWVCEVHFAYSGNLDLYFRSLKSRRHSQEIASNSNVAGSIIDKHELDEPVVGVYFEGKAQLLEAGKDQDVAAECLKSRLNITDDLVEEAVGEDGHQFYKITVANWYVFGGFGGTSEQKYKLEWNSGVK